MAMSSGESRSSRSVARDPDAATLHRIQNPAGQATKFGFDAGWQAIREPDLELDEAANPITRNTRRLLGWNSTADCQDSVEPQRPDLLCEGPDGRPV